MLKKTTLFFALLFAVFLTGVSTADARLQIDELIIMVPGIEEGRNDAAVITALTALPGVTIVDFCNSQKCYYLTIDRSQQADDRSILDAIRSNGFKPEVKTSGTIQDAQNNCADR